MVNVTSPDNIPMWQLADAASLTQESQTQGAAIQVALNKRQRYDFVWPTSTERTAQTGMAQGSRGYQVDTKTEYLYDNSAWRLATSYIEFNNGSSGSPQSYPNGVLTAPSPLTVNMTLSTDTTFVTTTSGNITFINPGIYALSWTISAQASTGTNSYAAVYDSAGLTNFITLNGFTQGATTVALPFYRITAANTTLYPRINNLSGGAVNMFSFLRVGRIA